LTNCRGRGFVVGMVYFAGVGYGYVAFARVAACEH